MITDARPGGARRALPLRQVVQGGPLVVRRHVHCWRSWLLVRKRSLTTQNPVWSLPPLSLSTSYRSTPTAGLLANAHGCAVADHAGLQPGVPHMAASSRPATSPRPAPTTGILAGTDGRTSAGRVWFHPTGLHCIKQYGHAHLVATHTHTHTHIQLSWMVVVTHMH